MKPIDTFRFLMNNHVMYDYYSISRCYAPVMGPQATSLYTYLVSAFDNGAQSHTFTSLLNHLQYGMPQLEKALSVLIALELLVFYQDKDSYLIKLCPSLSQEAFLAHSLYRRLLEREIGEVAVDEMLINLPTSAKPMTKKFSEVFSEVGQLDEMLRVPATPEVSFDMDSFKMRMVREGLFFADESEDTIALYHFADKHQLNWYQVYELARQTAIANQISLIRMAQKHAQMSQTQLPSNDFSEAELSTLREVKASTAEDFLSKIKKWRKATIVADERQILTELARLGFLDEVINVMVLYTFSKTKSANLNRRYIEKLANDLSFQGIQTAQEAIVKLRQVSGQVAHHRSTKSSQQNVPTWSNEDYQNQTSQDEQKRLEEIKRRALEKVRKEGD